MSTVEDENKRLARRYPEDVATEGNIDLLDELLAEDYVEHGPLGDVHGVEEDKAQMQSLLAAIPDFEATVEDAIAEGDTVAMRVTLSGTPESEYMGIEPTGSSFEVQNMVFTRIREGKIAERWLQPDMLGQMQQLGVIEPLDE